MGLILSMVSLEKVSPNSRACLLCWALAGAFEYQNVIIDDCLTLLNILVTHETCYQIVLNMSYL